MKENAGLFTKSVTENERLKEISYAEHLHLTKTSLNTILFLAYGETVRKKRSRRKKLPNGSKRESSSRWVIYENLSGNGFAEIAGHKYPLQPEDVVLLQPFADARVCPEEGQTLSGRYICIYDSIVMAAMGSALALKTAGVFHLQEDPCIRNLFDRVKAIVTDSVALPETERELSLICYELLYELSARKREDSSDPKFEHFLRQLSANCARQHTLAGMAKTCGVTPRTLTRLFHAKLSMSPIQYLINIRLDYAAMWLRRGGQNYTIKAVAEKCGYRNVPFFSREFRKKFSMTPSEYIKKYRTVQQ
ncbi:MAG: helix-turn-helix transcriptional regulator [Lentisphaeria bacterium]|nr:helix-turn-helix transcriptional regulator [Lentisphaeria bacterium]